MTQPQPKQLKQDLEGSSPKEEYRYQGCPTGACPKNPHNGNCGCKCHQSPDKDMKTNPWIKGMEKSTGKSFKSPDTFTIRECINGHKMTGVGFDDCCPECEAPWKDSGVEWEKPTVGEVLRWLDKLSFLSSTSAKLIHVKNLLASSRSQVVELIKRMKNHNEMLEMEGKKYTEGFEKALSDLLDKLR